MYTRSDILFDLPTIPADVPERDPSVSRTDDTYEYVLQPERSNDENMESATNPYEYVQYDFNTESLNTQSF